jgi:hypothetical protein
MKPYKITEVDEDLVDDFIDRSAKDHRSNNRTLDEVKEDIRIGKLGEIAYKQYCGNSINEIDWKGIVQMDGLDFTHEDGRGIQVKTMREDTKWCTFYNWKWDVLVVMRMIGNSIHLIGEFDKEYIKANARKSNWNGWYINPEII